MSGTDLVGALAFFLASGAAASPGVVFRPGEWYRAIAKPSWCPPDRLFAPVWTLLYLSIALSGWLVWRTGHVGGFTALVVYGAHLVLNALWSPIFFGLRRPGLALFEIVCLWAGIVATMFVFHSINVLAAYILIPYLLWVSFAVALNFSIWRLNAGSRMPSGRGST